MQTEDRLHYMDNLRAIAMLAGVVFHAALAYSPLMHGIWPTADNDQSMVVDAFAWFLHTFRMPLFFLVAGFFAALLVARRGMSGFFRNRGARVLLPLMVFLPLVLLSTDWLTEHALSTVAQPSPMLVWLRDYVGQHGAMPTMPGWMHLWFLFYLLLFTVLTWVVSALEFGRLGARFVALPPWVLLLVLPVLLALPLAWVSVPWPAPQLLLPSLWALLHFGGYFALGYQLFHNAALLERLRAFSPWLLGGAVAVYTILFVLTQGFTVSQTTALPHFLHALLESYPGFWMTLWCLLAAKRWLHGRSAIMRWLADASYWLYLVHLPLLFAIQYRLLDLSLHWVAKFAIATLVTFALSFISYQVLVRHSIIGRMLNGTTPKDRQRVPLVTTV
ncbi:MAG: acyltransferase family protein [Permianibacter sp.]